MAFFLWVLLWSILLMFGTVIGVSFLSKAYLKKYPKSEPVFPVAGIMFVCLSMIPAVWVAVRQNWMVQLAGLFLIVAWMLWAYSQFKGWVREGMIYALCVLASLFVPTYLYLFLAVPAVVAYFILGTCLYVMCRLFAIMDRVSELSMMTLLSQGILAVLIAHMGLIPNQLLLAFFYMFVVVMSLSQTIRVFSGYAILGPYAALASGFISGFLWIYVMASGSLFIPVVLYSYDMLEVVIAAGMTYWLTRKVCPIAVPFLLERAQATGFKPKKLTHFMFLILLIIAFLSVSNLSARYIFGAEIFVLFSIYYMLNGWGKPKPTFKDLAKDLKKGFSELKTQMNELPLKEKASKRTKRKK